MAGTARGARSAFDDDGGNRKKPWWLWLLGLLALLLIAGLLIALLSGGDDEEKSGSAAATTTQTTPQENDQATSGGSADGGTLTVAGTSLLPPPSDLSQYVGETATGENVVVQAVAGQQGFWVGTSKEDRVYVEYGAKAGGTEAGAEFKPKVGEKVNLTGPVRPAPEQPGRTLRVEVADEKIIKRQGAYINADTVESSEG